MRKEVISTAAEHGLRMRPEQISPTKYTEPTLHRVCYVITVNCTACINLLVYSYVIHFFQSNR